MKQEINYLIYGTGALGSVFGGFLQLSGANVTFVGLGDHFTTMLKSGLKLTGIWGDHYLEKIKGGTNYNDLTKKFDVILLCVKSYHTSQAISEAKTLLKADGLVLSIQNGLQNIETISEHVGKQSTIGGRIIFGASVPKPGTVKVTVYADKVLLGSPFLNTNPDMLKKVVSDIDNAGIPTEEVSQSGILANIWGKVLYNSALNPLGAILNVSYGELADSNRTKNLMDQIVYEIFAVMEQKGIETPYASPEDYLEVFYNKLIPPTRSHYSSMYQDLENGRKTEIDALNGAIVAYGEQLDVKTPVNRVISQLIHFKEQNVGINNCD